MQQLNPNTQFRTLVGDLSDVIDEAILHMLESHHPDDRVLASLAEARGGVVKMNHALSVVVISIANDHDRVYADEARAIDKTHTFGDRGNRPTEALPKLKPQKGIKRVGLKVRKPTDYACPACGAESGTACFTFSSRGKKGVPTTERHPLGGPYHKSRQALSSQANAQARREYDRKHGL